MPWVRITAFCDSRVFSDYSEDPEDSKKILFQYSGGEQCVGHQRKHTTLEVICNREIATPFEIQEIREIGPCETVIISYSPVVCIVPPKAANSHKAEKKVDVLKRLNEIENQLAELQNQIWEIMEDLHSWLRLL